MGLETGTYISDLNSANPLGTDAKSAGDDHLRLIKSTVKATFPDANAAVGTVHGGGTAPTVPTNFQTVWYDSTNGLYKIYNGTSWIHFTPTILSSGTAPSAPVNFKTLWYDTGDNVYKYYNGTSWIQIAPTVAEAQNSAYLWGGTAGGTANALTLTLAPTLTAYQAGQKFLFIAASTNTGTATANIDAVGALGIQNNGAALQPGDIEAGGMYELAHDGTQFQLSKFESKVTAYPKGHIAGNNISNGTDTDHDIDVASGLQCRDEANTVNMDLSSGLTKQIDAPWAEGTAAGGFPSGLTLTANTWYHFFVIHKTADGTIDGGFDTAINASNLLADATGYSGYRRLGSVLTDSTSNVIQFVNKENFFIYVDPVQTDLRDLESTNYGTIGSWHSITLSFPPIAGITAHLRINGSSDVANAAVYLRDKDISFTISGSWPGATIGFGAGDVTQYKDVIIGTDSSSQVEMYVSESGTTNTIIRISPIGWWDDLGRN